LEANESDLENNTNVLKARENINNTEKIEEINDKKSLKAYSDVLHSKSF
jgi:hypothetical protein